MRILLAEDDTAIADGICASLRHRGHAVDHAANGILADAALRDHSYDLLVLDLGLPALDGSEVLRRLRRAPAPLCQHRRACPRLAAPAVLLVLRARRRAAGVRRAAVSMPSPLSNFFSSSLATFAFLKSVSII